MKTPLLNSGVREYVFYVFSSSKLKKTRFLRFLEMTCQKRRKRYQSLRCKSIKSLAYTVRSETNDYRTYYRYNIV